MQSLKRIADDFYISDPSLIQCAYIEDGKDDEDRHHYQIHVALNNENIVTHQTKYASTEKSNIKAVGFEASEQSQLYERLALIAKEANLTRLADNFYIRDWGCIRYLRIDEIENDNELMSYHVGVAIDGTSMIERFCSGVNQPSDLYDHMAKIAKEANLIKISPCIYVRRDISVLCMAIEQFMGEYPESSQKCLIRVAFNGADILDEAWLGGRLFPTYQSAVDFLTESFRLNA